LEAALELIAQQRFKHTTIEQIAAPVQVFSRTFLRYVPTKEDLIVAWVDDEFGALLHKLKERPLSEPPAWVNKAAKCSP
jgi:AcrR family transcriptional regulator